MKDDPRTINRRAKSIAKAICDSHTNSRSDLYLEVSKMLSAQGQFFQKSHFELLYKREIMPPGKKVK